MDINYSIIIPHYNIPDLLMRCLRSIPVREDVQVIVVDDCSPDADTYLERYPELSRPYLEFYSTEKGGSAGRARNVGLRHAKGKWLIFIDSDDFFTDRIDAILNKAFPSNADLVFTKIKSVDSDNIYNETERSGSSSMLNHVIKYLNGEEDESGLKYDFPALWGKIISYSLVKDNKILFHETRWANDIFFSIQVGCLARKIDVFDEYLYVATKREGSLTYSFLSSEREFFVRIQESICSEDYMICNGVRNPPKPSVAILQSLYNKYGQLFYLKVMWRNRKDSTLFSVMKHYYLTSRKEAVRSYINKMTLR